MPILVICIIISLSLYLFYKVKYFRTNRPAEKKWISAKSSLALGSFVGLFGVNQLFLNGPAVAYIVAAVFIILGCLTILGGIKAYKFYFPLAVKEAEEMNK